MTSTFTALPSFKVKRRTVPFFVFRGSFSRVDCFPVLSLWTLYRRGFRCLDRLADNDDLVVTKVSVVVVVKTEDGVKACVGV